MPDSPDEASAKSGEETLKKLREKLKKAVEEKQEYLEGWQRARADFANYKREEAAAHGDKTLRIKGEFLENLLPTLDSFEMALRHAPDNKELELVHKQLIAAIARHGVKRFGAAGGEFDPHRHEALRQIDTDNPDEDHMIESVERSGYSMGEKIIRPAQVIIKNYHG